MSKSFVIAIIAMLLATTAHAWEAGRIVNDSTGKADAYAEMKDLLNDDIELSVWCNKHKKESSGLFSVVITDTGINYRFLTLNITSVSNVRFDRNQPFIFKWELHNFMVWMHGVRAEKFVDNILKSREAFVRIPIDDRNEDFFFHWGGKGDDQVFAKFVDDCKAK